MSLPSKEQPGNVAFDATSEGKNRAKVTVDPGPAAQSGHPSTRAPASIARQTSTAPKAARQTDITSVVLNLEREARQAESEAELGYLMVNGSRVAVQYRQAILLMRSGPGKHKVTSVSSLSAVDRNATFVRWIERLAAEKITSENLGKIVSFNACGESGKKDLDASSYPFSGMALLPLKLRDETVFGHLLLTRENVWDEPGLVAAARLCETYSHAWEALAGPRKLKRRLRTKSVVLATIAGALLLAGFIPVPLTVLAPAEVTAANPDVVASPIDGVIEKVLVEPNTPVKKGDALFEFVDTDLRNRLKLAEQAVSVADARYQQLVRTSFADSTAKRELAIAQSELELKQSEYDYARELLTKSMVKANANGLIIFSDKDTWTGRPVSTGERIMRIADPGKVEVTVQLPVSDAIVLNKGARVKYYLDSDPLDPVEAQLISASFHAVPDEAGVLAYKVKARFGRDGRIPRIGLRGTAQIYGENVSLGYYLFRKPISVIRQWTGY